MKRSDVTILAILIVHALALLALLVVATLRISPAQSGEASATPTQVGVATPTVSRAREGGVIFHTERSPEISNGDSPAPGRDLGVVSLPAQPEHSRVTKQSAGAARGGRAGIGSSSEPKAMATSAQAAGTAASIASYSAGMVVTPAAHQEARRA
jgi:hypothetical protein